MARNTIVLAAGIASLILARSVTAGTLSPVVEGNNQFAVDLYKQLAAADSDNLLVSPLSISTALAMTYAGARGQTEAEMADVLHFTLPHDQLHAEMGALITALNDPDREYELNVANRLWGQVGYSYRPEYLATTREHYGAALAEVDFVHDTECTRQAINTWVEEQTREKIKDLIPAGGLNELTRLVLTNAVYFKSDWSYQFDPDQTRSAQFSVTSDEQIDVPMMSQQNTFRYGETPGVQILEMPYGSFAADAGNSGAVENDNVSMVVLLPRAVDGLSDLEASLDADSLMSTVDQQLSPTDVRVEFPKFDLTDEIGLNDTLATMGMPKAFGDTADFSGISEDRLSISDVLHKSYIRVNEEGTEAAAATGVVVGITSVAPQPPTFRADHPFLFLIRDNPTGSILFMGRVGRPEVSTEADIAATELQAGDANQDLQFDQFDLVQVQQAGKYFTAEPATWGEGDWNGAPGGTPGNPPLGDGVFDQFDILAALQTGTYLTSANAAVRPSDLTGNDLAPLSDVDLVYVPEPSTSLLLAFALFGLVKYSCCIRLLRPCK